MPVGVYVEGCGVRGCSGKLQYCRASSVCEYVTVRCPEVITATRRKIQNKLLHDVCGHVDVDIC